ncbi:MAG: VWA domain-containing protein [Acidimicrobiia bacterium]|nr:VWA domain-containing protein [Acidimicrobiia bacterium]MDH3396487.1 VWA domain-containing protein [Acidimicrobiia bacterium]
MLGLLTGFIEELRGSGIPVSMVEAIDAAEALRFTDLGDRQAFKATLGSTLVKNARHYEAFETAFEVYFALLRPAPGDAADDAPPPAPATQDSQQGIGGGGGEADLESLIESLKRALSEGDRGLLRAVARRSVGRLAGMERGRPVGGTYYLYRTLRRLDIDRILEALVESADASLELTALEARLLREEYEDRIEEFREEVRAEIRRRLVADRGREAVAKTLRRPLLEDTDLMHASREDLAMLGQVIHPLTRKLAARLAQRRRQGRRGRLDFRRTVRRSLSTGGVPMEPQFRTPRPTKPEVFLLCDISGSMATFARFTLQFVHAMSGQFSKLRSFVFVDGLDEVTSFFEAGAAFESALERVGSEAEVVWLDGHSDYGHALAQFWKRYGGDLTPRSTVIVTGDARNNYRDARGDVMASITEASRAVYWLNPEPQAYWDTGDSVISVFAGHCDGVFEVRSLRQLEAFVEGLALPRRRPGGVRAEWKPAEFT